MYELSIDERMEELVGQFVVVTKSRKDGQLLFYIDKKLRGTITSKWWSIFVENAKGFASLEDAIKLAKSLKYNNPNVYKVVDPNYDHDYDIKRAF
ncbi:hypothetical protein GHU05_07035 [Fructobacillus tropaeoli]|uniref:hypothetical protein n=1 Tax=Fructobacillus tropaeoli TaxID=709323 RepID=UPI001455ED7C|nr:hypothetical protein [Fructobacillus tropaeoli]NLS38674.1 hypothetical protein [Fructobacillus tropaeoli]